MSCQKNICLIVTEKRTVFLSLTDSQMYPVQQFELYLSKLSPNCNDLWQKPRRVRALLFEDVWYEPRRVGHSQLEKFMSKLSTSLALSQHYTNHCIRATGMTILNEEGFEARHICALSSHKNESTVRNYAVKCPVPKKKQMCDTLAIAMEIPAKKAKTETVSKPPEQNQFPEDPLLQEFDLDDDDMLLKVLENIENHTAQLEENKAVAPQDPAVPQENPQPTEKTVAVPQEIAKVLVEVATTVQNQFTFNQVANVAPKKDAPYVLSALKCLNYHFHN